MALRSFAAALALRDALVAMTNLPDAFSLKWPNDVLLNGGKLAGILLESAANGVGVAHLAIGIGVNLIARPEVGALEAGALTPVSLLQETGQRIEPEVFLNQLALAYDRWETHFISKGFAPLRSAWLSHAAKLGELVRVRTGSTTRSGIFQTIDASGALILETSEGSEAIPAAEVFF